MKLWISVNDLGQPDSGAHLRLLALLNPDVSAVWDVFERPRL